MPDRGSKRVKGFGRMKLPFIEMKTVGLNCCEGVDDIKSLVLDMLDLRCFSVVQEEM